MTSRLAALAAIAALLAPIGACDHRLEDAVQSTRRPALERPMHLLSDGCNRTTVSAGLLTIALLGGTAGVEVARVAVVALIPTNLAVEGLKRLTHRTRPDGDQRRSNASFPSSHVANAFALAVVLGRRWRRALPWLLLAGLAIAWARLYLNRHYPSDVVCGGLLGAAIAWASAGACERWRTRAARARSGN